MTETNPFLPQPPLDGFLAGLRTVGDTLPDTYAEKLDAWRKSLIAQGEGAFEDPYIIDWARRQFASPAIIDGLAKVEVETGTPATDYILHSYRYSQWRNNRETFSPAYDPVPREALGMVALGAHPLNTYADGTPRRYEEGGLISLNRVRAAGIDPSRVLFYRVTQPAKDGHKPEPYWTSDSLEVRTGLTWELGARARTAIVLASTLEQIATNGGLIDDVNDDQGHAVRQAGLGPFDQAQALFTFPRQAQG